MTKRIPASAPTILTERAYQLARSGAFEFVYQVERQLHSEGFTEVAREFAKNAALRDALRECLKPYRKPGTGSRPR